ncbi:MULTISPECIES: F0F1 ATP synthase subunit epsilon [Cryobacterium]|uniref:F0F1 ATP synthase subunit epsilon n=1 Tax=Cryobacterium zongtaii TaxID=1259217 RepID=A0A2S3ZL49_9MICO|nr:MULTISPECIES: F0F1 ATP synthase subunit epsilon [Cryobacterium]ASD21377.1 ATP synthase F1 subunit epsilon [Cryobacterium sp. LW097]POH69074.1 F0F1 ATP synthase subunit epsilon [Cryobacterium zongtaii]POH69493.1 F0F1 ATP synthase subunit epsilon [Cryobacterium zongtaii]TFC46020.1 F0F1 ATP synthase subunit epsilon [Cryobacterium sp. TMN-39-2]TFC58859.1 F0F1 ATP synthase subunit epsilon [Cryobacterium sp. TMB3-1-2]
MASASLTVTLVSADQQVWSGEASMVVARTVEGEIGILVGHEPLLAILSSGEVRITLLDGTKVVAEADDGFLSVDNDIISIVARRAALV